MARLIAGGKTMERGILTSAADRNPGAATRNRSPADPGLAAETKRAARPEEVRHLRRVILASASPRRRELLSRLGVSFEVWPSAVDEGAWETGATGAAADDPAWLVLGLARAKAERVAGALGEAVRKAVVLAADTVVVLDGEILAKPADRADARRMLERLSGRTHTVWTGVACLDGATGAWREAAVATGVTFARLTDAEIERYLATGEGDDKAGGYALQGRAAAFVEAISGSDTNVVGLPLATVRAMFLELGLYPPPAARE